MPPPGCHEGCICVAAPAPPPPRLNPCATCPIISYQPPAGVASSPDFFPRTLTPRSPLASSNLSGIKIKTAASACMPPPARPAACLPPRRRGGTRQEHVLPRPAGFPGSWARRPPGTAGPGQAAAYIAIDIMGMSSYIAMHAALGALVVQTGRGQGAAACRTTTWWCVAGQERPHRHASSAAALNHPFPPLPSPQPPPLGRGRGGRGLHARSRGHPKGAA